MENIQNKTLYKCKKCNNKLQLINIEMLYRHNRDNDLYSFPESLSQVPTHIWAHYQCSTCDTTYYIEYNLEQTSIQEVSYEL